MSYDKSVASLTILLIHIPFPFHIRAFSHCWQSVMCYDWGLLLNALRGTTPVIWIIVFDTCFFCSHIFLLLAVSLHRAAYLPSLPAVRVYLVHCSELNNGFVGKRRCFAVRCVLKDAQHIRQSEGSSL